MRIVSGKLKGRVLQANDAEGLRPTTEKVREAIFSTLQSMCTFEAARVLDLYAGTGSLGIEALSRGAASAVFVEKHRQSCERLTKTIDDFDLRSNANVVCSDVMKYLSAFRAVANNEFDLVFADPPYEDHPGVALAPLLAQGLVREGSILVIESAANLPFEAVVGEPDAGLFIQPLKDKIYGDTKVSYFRFEVSGGRVE